MSASYELIARRAFEIWEREGRPQGQDQEHWFRAESELGKESMKMGEAKAVLASNPASPRTPALTMPATGKRGERPAPNQGARAPTRSRV